MTMTCRAVLRVPKVLLHDINSSSRALPSERHAQGSGMPNLSVNILYRNDSTSFLSFSITLASSLSFTLASQPILAAPHNANSAIPNQARTFSSSCPHDEDARAYVV